MIHLTEIYCYASSQTKSSNSTSKPKERRKTMTNDVKHNGTQSISTKWFTFNLNYHYECSFVSIYFLFRLQRADDTFFRAFTRSWAKPKIQIVYAFNNIKCENIYLKVRPRLKHVVMSNPLPSKFYAPLSITTHSSRERSSI